MSKAAIKGAADLKLVGSHVAEHKTGFNVLGPSVADIGGGLADGHLLDEEATLGSDCLDVFFETGGETKSRVKSLGVEDALEHCLEVLSRLRRCTNYGIPEAEAQPLAQANQAAFEKVPFS